MTFSSHGKTGDVDFVRPGKARITFGFGTRIVDGVPLHAYTLKHKDQTVPTTLYVDGKGLPARVETNDGSGRRAGTVSAARYFMIAVIAASISAALISPG